MFEHFVEKIKDISSKEFKYATEEKLYSKASV